MIAVLGGVGAALAWTVATLCSTRASRTIGVAPTLAWVMLVGFVIVAPAVAVEGKPAALDPGTAGWLVLAGAGNVLGLGLEYAGLRAGKVGLVVPIASTEGAIAAVIAILAGEQISPGLGAALAAVAIGVVLAAAARGGESRDRTRATWLAIGAAISFGAGLYAIGRVSDELPLAWTLLPTRAVGVLAVTLPLVVAGALPHPRPVGRLVVVAGLCEVLGLASFVLGARDGIAVAAVLASQFAALTAIAAYLLFHERLARVQIAGIAVIAVGVAAVAALEA